MSQPVYKINAGSIHEKFQASQAKIQIFGGGFGNGKTTSGCIKALRVARDYPGANILMARATLPKLNDTLRKEFIKWLPKEWIESFPQPNDKSSTCKLVNGSTINFRYVQQQGKSNESSTSNLLSATYDLIVVDQMEDPEISHKDFLDLFGRLRGNAKYNPPVGAFDPTMPEGCRQFIGLVNPTRNWVYKKLVKPYHDYLEGRKNKDLIVDSKTGLPLIEMFEGSTYENAHNLAEDFIGTLESLYKGQMKDRFLMGKWAAYEGLVYPDYDETIHLVTEQDIAEYYWTLRSSGVVPAVIEAYDYGISQPSCYGLAFCDKNNNVVLADGFYGSELRIDKQIQNIKAIRRKWGVKPSDTEVHADPQLFKRSKKDEADIAEMFRTDSDGEIRFVRANNSIAAGITKVSSYLSVVKQHINPFTKSIGAPHFYVNSKLDWFDAEICDYHWKKDAEGVSNDIPIDKNDHAMDMTKYLLSKRPKIAMIMDLSKQVPSYLTWQEYDKIKEDPRGHRYGQ